MNSTLVDPSALLRGVAGNHDADLLRELHQRHAGALSSFALRLTGDRGRAQNLVQETLLRAWRDPRILDPECGSQLSGLYAVARNIVIEEWPTASWSPEAGIDRILDQPIGGATAPVVDRELVVAALNRLTEDHRHVLRECYFRGSSVAEAAHALGITPDLVKSRTYYALRALRLAIEELRALE